MNRSRIRWVDHRLALNWIRIFLHPLLAEVLTLLGPVRCWLEETALGCSMFEDWVGIVFHQSLYLQIVEFHPCLQRLDLPQDGCLQFLEFV